MFRELPGIVKPGLIVPGKTCQDGCLLGVFLQLHKLN